MKRFSPATAKPGHKIDDVIVGHSCPCCGAKGEPYREVVPTGTTYHLNELEGRLKTVTSLIKAYKRRKKRKFLDVVDEAVSLDKLRIDIEGVLENRLNEKS